MDSLRKILILVQKYHFWGLAVLVVVVVGLFWSSASARFSDIVEKRKLDIQQDFKNMYQLAEMPDPVNEKVHSAIRGVHEQLQKNVMRVWRYLYEEQKKNNPLPAVLGERFREEWEKRGPKEELPHDLREHYWNFIERYFPQLLKKADIRRPKNLEQGTGPRVGSGRGRLVELAGSGGARPEQIEYEGIVVWEEANYKQFLARFHWDQLPSTQKVRLAQEDLWVYETLLGIVKELNKDATSHYNAVVKRIYALDIAQFATKAFEEARDALGLRSLRGMGAPGVGGPGGMPADLGAAMAALQPGGPPEVAGAPMPEGLAPRAGVSESDYLYARRYVDQNEQSVPVENGTPKHPFSEFKMMPIRMRLLMDQRKIPELLVLCANSKMPIEVRQVRINPGRAAKVNYGAGRTAAAMTSGAGPVMEFGGSTGPAGSGPSTLEGLWAPPIPGQTAGVGLGPEGSAGVGETFYQGPYDLVVEVLGIIYIYEPPDESKLGTGAATSSGPSMESAPSPAEPTGAAPAVPAVPGGAQGPAGGPPPGPPPSSPGSLPGAAGGHAEPESAPTPAGTPAPGTTPTALPAGKPTAVDLGGGGSASTPPAHIPPDADLPPGAPAPTPKSP